MKLIAERLEWLEATPARRRLVTGVSVVALIGLLVLGFWYRSAVDSGRRVPWAVTALLALLAVGSALERGVALQRAFRRPCRHRAAFTKGWLEGPLVIGCLIGFGGWGLFDSDPSNQWIALGMFATGVMSLALLASWSTKPICADDPE